MSRLEVAKVRLLFRIELVMFIQDTMEMLSESISLLSDPREMAQYLFHFIFQARQVLDQLVPFQN